MHAGGSFNHIDISPRPSDRDPLTGGDTLGSPQCETLSNTMKIRCSVNESSTPILIDQNLGPIGINYTSSMVHAWNHSVGTVNITFTMISGGITMLRHILQHYLCGHRTA